MTTDYLSLIIKIMPHFDFIHRLFPIRKFLYFILLVTLPLSAYCIGKSNYQISIIKNSSRNQENIKNSMQAVPIEKSHNITCIESDQFNSIRGREVIDENKLITVETGVIYDVYSHNFSNDSKYQQVEPNYVELLSPSVSNSFVIYEKASSQVNAYNEVVTTFHIQTPMILGLNDLYKSHLPVNNFPFGEPPDNHIGPISRNMIRIADDWYILVQIPCLVAQIACGQHLYKFSPSNNSITEIPIPDKYSPKILKNCEDKFACFDINSNTNFDNFISVNNTTNLLFTLIGNHRVITYDTIKGTWTENKESLNNIFYDKLSSFTSVIDYYDCVFYKTDIGKVVFLKEKQTENTVFKTASLKICTP